MSLLPSPHHVRLLAFVALCLLVVGVALTVGGAAHQTDSDNRTEVSHSLTITLENVPADGEPRTVYVSVPDNLAGTVSVDSVDARGVGLEPTDARVADGPDNDGTRETVAIDVRASGGGVASGSVGVTLVASYPDLTQEEAEQITVGSVSGGVKYTVDDSDPLFQRAIDNSDASVTAIVSAQSLLAVTPPSGVLVDSLSAGITTEDDLSLSVPLDRITDTAGIAVEPRSLTFEEGVTTRNIEIESTGAATLTVRSIVIQGNDSVFQTSGVPDRIDPGQTNVVTVEHTGSGGENATLSIRSNGMNMPNAAVDLSATPRNQTDEEDDTDDTDEEDDTDDTDGEDDTDDTDEGERETREPDSMEFSERDGETQINVTVQNVTEGESVSMSMPSEGPAAQEQGDVAIENISMTAATDGNFNMSISTGENVTESAPELNTSDKEPLGFFSIDHEWDNENVSETRITVRVEKSRVDSLEDTDPEEVALYRYVEDEWQEERTEYRGETATHYRYSVFATGYSDWATAGKQPDFQIVETGLNVTSDVEVDDAVEVTVRIENDGQADGDYETTLWLNNVRIDSREVTIAPGGTGQVIFERTLNQAGTYEVRVNNVTVDQIEVQGTPETESGSEAALEDETQSEESDGDDGMPLFLLAGGLLLASLVVGGGVYYRSNGSDPGRPSDSRVESTVSGAPAAETEADRERPDTQDSASTDEDEN